MSIVWANCLPMVVGTERISIDKVIFMIHNAHFACGCLLLSVGTFWVATPDSLCMQDGEEDL